MKRMIGWLTLATAALLTVFGVLASPAQAASGNPHFIKNATTGTLNGTTLTVGFKETGLASGSVETVTVSGTVATTYECVNGGGKNPSASNKHTFVTNESVSGTFTADQNGNIVGSESLTVPSAASLGFSCPSGQTVTLVSVSYSNVSVTDSTSGATTTLAGTFTYTNPDAPAVK
jgi:hypothetical protein